MLLAIESSAVRALTTTPAEFHAPGVIAPFYLSDVGWISAPTDAPAHQLFDPRVSLPLQWERSIPATPDQGVRMSIAIGEIVLRNEDKLLDAMVDGFAIDGRRVVVRIGGPDFAYGDFETLFDGTATGWRLVDDNTLRVDLRDAVWRLERPVQETVYGGGGHLDGGADIAGKPKPIGLGDLTRANVPAVLVNASQLIYQVHDGAIDGIVRVRDRGLALDAGGNVPDILAATPLPGQYQTQNSGGYFKLGSVPAGLVTVDFRGDATGGYTAAPTDLALRVLLNRAGIGVTEIDGFSFQALRLKQHAAVGLWLGLEPVAITTVLDRLFHGIGGWWGCNRLGKVQCGRIDLPDAGAITEDYDTVNILSLSRIQAPGVIDPPAWRRSVAYQPVYVVQTTDLAGAVSATDRAYLGQPFRVANTSDAAVKSRHLQAVDPPPIAGLFAEQIDGEAEAVRLFDLYKAARGIYRLRTKANSYRRELGETVRVTYPRFGLAAGRLGVIIGLAIDGAANETIVTVLA